LATGFTVIKPMEAPATKAIAAAIRNLQMAFMLITSYIFIDRAMKAMRMMAVQAGHALPFFQEYIRRIHVNNLLYTAYHARKRAVQHNIYDPSV